MMEWTLAIDFIKVFIHKTPTYILSNNIVPATDLNQNPEMKNNILIFVYCQVIYILTEAI